MRTRWITGAAAFLIVPFVLQGCGFGNNEGSEDMDEPPEEVTEEIEWGELEGETEEGEETETEAELEEGSSEESSNDSAETETVERELYLLDEEGMVVPQTFELPKEEGVLNQSLEYLVSDGPLTSMLPNGFRAVLPAGTEVDVNLKEGTAITDFSTEFRDYDPKHEQAILQAVTWTLTQFENVDDVSLRINGYEQETMPVNNTPIGESYSRENGINLENGQVSDMTGSDSVTIYFLSQNQEDAYYVPVTRRVEGQEDGNMLEAAMDELAKGPAADSSLYDVFREGTSLANEVTMEGETASLLFNEGLLTEQEGTAIAEEALHAIALSATEVEGVQEVELNVEGVEDVVKVTGESIEPLARPALVNADIS
ncbi:sporulation protein [Salibacterium salarium]|uniref:Sporulation protein n=2 Tax=Salibacterium salarium TaxID=284579 RepID=A0A3R9Q3D0_9BACI|nr:sporulation protein [Salibacterium salarium]